MPADREASHSLLTNALQDIELEDGWQSLLGRAQQRARSQDCHAADDEREDEWEYPGLWRVRVTVRRFLPLQ